MKKFTKIMLIIAGSLAALGIVFSGIAAVMGAGLNVKINAASLKDKGVADGLVAEADRLMAEACGAEAAIIEMVNKVINKD